MARHPSDNVWLDCVRMMAITLVILRHGQRVVAIGPEASFAEALRMNGWAGVDLFFVLSGYLVSSGLLRTYSRSGSVDLKQYAMGRVRRIAPAYCFVLALVVVGYFPGFSVSAEHLGYRLAYHLLFLQDVLPSDINVVFWSLGVEAKYYAVFPFLVLMISRMPTFRTLFILGLVALLPAAFLRWAIFASSDITDYPTFWKTLRSPFYVCLEPIALGVFLAVLEQSGGLKLGGRFASSLFGVSLATLVLYLGSHVFLDRIDVWDATIQPVVVALLFATLVAAAIAMKPRRTTLEPVFRFGARISYSLYLVHFPLIPLSVRLANEHGLGVVGFWCFYICISLAHAVAIFLYIETPFMKRGSSGTNPLSVK